MKYLTAKFVLIVSLAIFCCSTPDSDIEASRWQTLQYAKGYSGTESTRSWDDKYWDDVCEFSSSDDYNRAMELNRQPEMKYTDTEDAWLWIADSLRLSYCEMRTRL